MADTKLSGNFWLSEAPCWTFATASDVAQLQEFAARVLQPIRSHFDVPVFITSWKWWRDGCTPRSGAHAFGAVDFQVSAGLTRAAWEWGAQHLVPSGYIGRWIYEPARSSSEGTPQGEHIHAAPRSAMVAAFGDDRIQVLEETTEGQYVLHFDSSDPASGWGGPGSPIDLPGLTVTAGAPGLFGFLGALALIGALARRPSPSTT